MKKELVQLPERVKGCCVCVTDLVPAETADGVAAVYKALADPTRVQIVHVLKSMEEAVCVCDLTEAFELGQPTVSHHLAKLREAGIIVSTKQGIWTFHRLNPDMPDVARAAVALVP